MDRFLILAQKCLILMMMSWWKLLKREKLINMIRINLFLHWPSQSVFQQFHFKILVSPPKVMILKIEMMKKKMRQDHQ